MLISEMKKKAYSGDAKQPEECSGTRSLRML
jgi:hypothetical protein